MPRKKTSVNKNKIKSAIVDLIFAPKETQSVLTKIYSELSFEYLITRAKEELLMLERVDNMDMLDNAIRLLILAKVKRGPIHTPPEEGTGSEDTSSNSP